MKYKYEVYRCYEVTVRDADGNQIGESEFIYTTREDAVKRARELVKEIESEVSENE